MALRFLSGVVIIPISTNTQFVRTARGRHQIILSLHLCGSKYTNSQDHVLPTHLHALTRSIGVDDKEIKEVPMTIKLVVMCSKNGTDVNIRVYNVSIY